MRPYTPRINIATPPDEIIVPRPYSNCKYFAVGDGIRPAGTKTLDFWVEEVIIEYLSLKDGGNGDRRTC
jgi:hypothetical protein